MITLSNETGSKAVNITNNNGTFNAMYVQIFKESDGQIREQVLDSKRYASEKAAIKWGNKKLG